MDRFIPLTIPIAPRFPLQVRGEQSLYQLFCCLIGTIKGFACLKSCKNWHAMKHLSALFQAALSEEALPLWCGQHPGLLFPHPPGGCLCFGGFGGSTTHTWPTCTLLRLHGNGHEPLASFVLRPFGTRGGGPTTGIRLGSAEADTGTDVVSSPWGLAATNPSPFPLC